MPARARPASRGRRPGAPDTRAAVLNAAQASFAEKGFRGTTIRGVATAAGVDPALVHHYFGTKDDLFVAALEIPVDPRQALAPVLAGGIDGAGERLVRVFIGVWDDPANRLPLLGVARGAFEPTGRELLASGFLPAVVLPIGQAIGVDDPQRRMSLVASQLIGLIVVRYVLELEPIASMSVDELVAIYAPTIQRYLSGDLDEMQ